MSSKDFVIENGVLISYKGSDESVEIPSEVEKIGAGAFKNNRKIKNVVFNCKNLKSIEEDAFYDCTSLEGIKIPEGTVQIARRAFMGCTNMEYIYIPSSVMIIGDIATESSVAVFGSKGSEAEKYAQKRYATFKTDLSNGLRLINNKKLEKEGIDNKSFNVFGETITVSSSLKRYHEILEYYNKRQEEFFEMMLNHVPIDYTSDDAIGNAGDIYLNEYDLTIKRLEKSGIYVTEGMVCSYTGKSSDLMIKTYKLYIDAYLVLGKSALSDMNNQIKQFYNEAESQVTGLSYGHIGGGIGLAAYAFDDFFEKQKQRKRAYAIADHQKTTYINEQTSQVNGKLKELYDNFVPIFKKATDLFIDSLLKCEVDYCIKHGLIDADIKDKYDIIKSSEMLQGLYEKGSTNAEYVVALALKLYPMNVSAHIYAVQNNFVSQGLDNLDDFLGLENKLKPYKKARYDKVLSEIVKCTNASNGIAVIESYEFLTENEKKDILSALSVKLTEKAKNIIESNPSENVDLRDFCEKKLAGIIDEKSCVYFNKYSIAPIKFQGVSIVSVEDLSAYLEKSLSKRQDKKEEQLKKAENDLKKAETIEDYNNVLDSLEEINGYKNSKELINQAQEKLQALGQVVLDKISSEIDDAVTEDELLPIEKKLKELKGKRISTENAESKLSDKDQEFKNQKYEAYRIQQQKENLKKLIIKILAISASVAFVAFLVIYSKTPHYREFKKMVETSDFDYVIEYDDMLDYLEEDESFNKWARKTLAKKLTEYQVNEDFDAAIYLLSNYSTAGYFSSFDYHDNYLDIGANKSLIQWLIISSVEKGEFISGNEFTVECKSENSLIKYEVSWPESKDIFEIYEGETANSEAIFLDSGSVIAGENIDYSERMKKAEEKIEQYKLAAFEAEQAPKKESYEKALQLLNEGKKAAAAIAFAKAEDYLDARERSFALWDEVADRKTLLIGDQAIIGLRSDGSIIKKYGKTHSQIPNHSYITESKNYIAVSAGDYHSTYLCDNGTVRSNGYVNWVGDPFSEFTDIVAISACYDYNYDEYTVGLKYDGTVVSVPNRKYDKREGIKDWTDIIAVSAGYDHTVGLKSDGTVVAVGKNDEGQCNVGGWTDIIAVSAGDGYTVGLKSDGTVVAVGSNYRGECGVSGWSNIVAISAGGSHTVGLRADGTVVATKYTGDSEYNYGQCEVDGWSNIVAVSASGCHTIGLKSDGTIVLVGGSSFEDYDVPDCNDIKIPNN